MDSIPHSPAQKPSLPEESPFGWEQSADDLGFMGFPEAWCATRVPEAKDGGAALGTEACGRPHGLKELPQVTGT